MEVLLNNISKVKLTVMGIPDPRWSVGTAMQLPSCNKLFYDADHSR